MTSLAIRYPHVFGVRYPEWMGGMAAVLGGIGLLHPFPAFDTAAFYFVGGVVGETALGLLLVFIGVLRIIGLIINGRQKKVTPWIRVGAAFICWIIWSWLSLHFLASGAISIWLGAWPVYALSEFINMYRGAHDARVGYGRFV